MKHGTLHFTQIGVIHTPFAEQKGTPIQGIMAPEAEGTVEVFPEFQDGLRDLDGFSHIVLIYQFHHMGKGQLLVKPYLDTVERGIFATRSPRRPNPLGMTTVRLQRVDGNLLHVSGVDMLEGTPLIDIKPYLGDFDHHRPDKIGWYGATERRGQRVLADDRFDPALETEAVRPGTAETPRQD